MQPRTVEASPGPVSRTVRMPDGSVVPVPAGWELLPPGDPLVTRRVKAGGDYWAIREKVGRREMSRGVWAPAERIAKARRQAETERATPEYAKKLASGRARRDREQADYVVEFSRHVVAFLSFHPTHADLADTLAERIATHATPVGSGTVARTERIPVAERAEAAVIAWMRHQTTAYDHMTISRDKGARREVRRMLAKRSRELLDLYRRGKPAPEGCPLQAAVAKPMPAPAEPPPDRIRLRPKVATNASEAPVEARPVRDRTARPASGLKRAPSPSRTTVEAHIPVEYTTGTSSEPKAAVRPSSASPVRSPTPRPTPKPTAMRPTPKPAPTAPSPSPAPAAKTGGSPEDTEMARRAARQAAMRARLRQ